MIRPWIAINLLPIITPLLESVGSSELDDIAACWTDADLSTEDKMALEETL
jgi:hypothetical protein